MLSNSVIKLLLNPIIPLEERETHQLSLLVQLLIMIVSEQLDQPIPLWMWQNVCQICHVEKFSLTSFTDTCSTLL